MKGKCFTALLVGCFALASLPPATWAQERSLYQQTEYQGQEIGNLTGDVYWARMDDYLSVFMVTSEGIILVEPVGTAMATWLKGELARRFDVPVKYVIYSHHHWVESPAAPDCVSGVGPDRLIDGDLGPAGSGFELIGCVEMVNDRGFERSAIAYSSIPVQRSRNLQPADARWIHPRRLGARHVSRSRPPRAARFTAQGRYESTRWRVDRGFDRTRRLVQRDARWTSLARSRPALCDRWQTARANR